MSVGPLPEGISQLRYRLQLRCLHEAFPYLGLRYRLQLVSSRGVFTHNHITLFTGTTQDCATALLVVGPSPHGVSQLRYRLQLCASTRRFHSNSYHTFYGHHPGLCNCPVNSWPFATGGISVEISATTTLPPRGVSISQVEISATTCCLHEEFSLKLISHFLRAQPRMVQLPC